MLHCTCVPLRDSELFDCLGYFIFTTMTVKNIVFRNLMLCRSCERLRFGERCSLRLQGKIRYRAPYRNNNIDNHCLLQWYAQKHKEQKQMPYRSKIFFVIWILRLSLHKTSPSIRRSLIRKMRSSPASTIVRMSKGNRRCNNEENCEVEQFSQRTT
jgi:hypothetical protein